VHKRQTRICVGSFVVSIRGPWLMAECLPDYDPEDNETKIPYAPIFVGDLDQPDPLVAEFRAALTKLDRIALKIVRNRRLLPNYQPK